MSLAIFIIVKFLYRVRCFVIMYMISRAYRAARGHTTYVAKTTLRDTLCQAMEHLRVPLEHNNTCERTSNVNDMTLSRLA